MKKILLLIFSIAVLTAVYFKLEKPKEKFFSDFSEIDQITLIRNGETLKLVKQEDTWKIVEPLNIAVSKDFITNLSKTLNEITPSNVIEEADPKQQIYGLIPPEMLAIFQGKFGKEVISFGKYADFALARYIQRENDPKIYMFKEDLFLLLSSKLNNIVSKNPIQFKTENLQSIAVIPNTPPAFVIKKTEGKWKLESTGIKFDVDPQIFESAINKLSNLESFEMIVDANLELYGLTHPTLTISLLFNDGKNSKVLDFIVGKGTGPYYYLKELKSLTVFQIYKGAIADWLKEIDFFRNRKLFSLPELKEINAIGIMDSSAYVPAKEPEELNIEDMKIEIGDKVPGIEQEQSPQFIKITKDNHQYVAVLNIKDIDTLRSYKNGK